MSCFSSQPDIINLLNAATIPEHQLNIIKQRIQPLINTYSSKYRKYCILHNFLIYFNIIAGAVLIALNLVITQHENISSHSLTILSSVAVLITTLITINSQVLKASNVQKRTIIYKNSLTRITDELWQFTCSDEPDFQQLLKTVNETASNTNKNELHLYRESSLTKLTRALSVANQTQSREGLV